MYVRSSMNSNGRDVMDNLQSHISQEVAGQVNKLLYHFQQLTIERLVLFGYCSHERLVEPIM